MTVNQLQTANCYFQPFPLWLFRLRRSCKISVTLRIQSQFLLRCNRKTVCLAVTPLKKNGWSFKYYQDFAATPQLKNPKRELLLFYHSFILKIFVKNNLARFGHKLLATSFKLQVGVIVFVA